MPGPPTRQEVHASAVVEVGAGMTPDQDRRVPTGLHVPSALCGLQDHRGTASYRSPMGQENGDLCGDADPTSWYSA